MINYGFAASLGPISDVPTQHLRGWRNDPAVYAWCRQYEPLEWLTHHNWIDSLPGRPDVKMYGIFYDSVARGAAGLTGIDLINRRAEFSLYIAPEWQKKGYGTPALKTLCAHGFLALGLNHIFGETFEGNPAARMFESVGFTREGTRRQFYYREGRFIDAHLYSVLAPDFREKWKL